MKRFNGELKNRSGKSVAVPNVGRPCGGGGGGGLTDDGKAHHLEDIHTYTYF